MKFPVDVTHEKPWYVAQCIDVDVISQGETVEKAKNLRRRWSHP